MRRLRTISRLGRVLGSLAVYMLIARLGSLFLPRGSLRQYQWKNKVTRRLAARILRIFHVDIAVTGSPPQEPFLLVSNHLGYLDIVLLESLCPGNFISKSEVRNWPFIGWVVRSTNTLFVNRTNHRDLVRVNELITRALAAGESVVFFPEGTSSAGAQILPLKPSLLESAATHRIPVSHVTLKYETGAGDPPASEAVCWWGDMEFFPHMFLLAGCGKIQATVHFGATPVAAPQRKELANLLERAMKSTFEPSAPTEASAPSIAEVKTDSASSTERWFHHNRRTARVDAT